MHLFCKTEIVWSTSVRLECGFAPIATHYSVRKKLFSFIEWQIVCTRDSTGVALRSLKHLIRNFFPQFYELWAPLVGWSGTYRKTTFASTWDVFS